MTCLFRRVHYSTFLPHVQYFYLYLFYKQNDVFRGGSLVTDKRAQGDDAALTFCRFVYLFFSLYASPGVPCRAILRATVAAVTAKTQSSTTSAAKCQMLTVSVSVCVRKNSSPPIGSRSTAGAKRQARWRYPSADAANRIITKPARTTTSATSSMVEFATENIRL